MAEARVRRAFADFEPHAQSWTLWPVRPDNWREHAGPAQRVFLDLIRCLAQDEPVMVGAPSDILRPVRDAVPDNVCVVPMEYDDVWVRDTGPTFVQEDALILGVDWRFNSWGGADRGLFGTWGKDDSVARQVLEAAHLPRLHSDLVLEGGAIMVDGRGTLITTRECLLNPNRNCSMTESEYEQVFADLLGVRQVVWINEGLADDEAGGHVDNVAAFLSPGRVLVVDPDSSPLSQRERARDVLRTLQAARDADGNRFELIPVPIPESASISEVEAAGFAPSDGAIQRQVGTQMAASYINLVFTNQRLLVPLFEDPMDDVALGILRDVSKHRAVHGVASRELVLGGGALHCVVAHQPTINKHRSVNS